MRNIFKRKKKYPPFAVLNSFDKKNCYFLRIAQWDWLSKDIITITDPNNPRILTLDPWPQLVFIAANGQMTVTEYVYYMADKYSNDIPEVLDKTIIDELNTLIEFKVIKFVDQRQRPQPEFELPLSNRK